MSLQGLGQTTDPYLNAHIQSVRLFMRDFAELNLLIAGEESSDRMIAWATQDFLSDFNGTSPMTAYTLQGLILRQQAHLAVRGTVISLLQSVMLLYIRNYLPYSDGGLTIQLHDRAPMIQGMLGLLQSSYEQKKRLVKTEINIEQMLDIDPSGVHSDYLTLTALGVF